MKKIFFSEKSKKEKGSMLIGALLALFMVAIISLAIVKRAVIGLNIAIDSGKSYQSYQESDKSAEGKLAAIRELDDALNNPSIFQGYDIPENLPAEAICGNASEKRCKKYDATTGGYVDIEEDDKADKIKRILQKGEEGSSVRSVEVPVPGRINNPIRNLKVEQCLGINNPLGCVPDPCYVKISWEEPDISDIAEGYEIRRYTNGNSQDTNNDCLLSKSQDGKGWYNIDIDEVEVNEDERYVIAKGGNDGNTFYCFTIKLKNKKNFNLDSLYYDEDDAESRDIKLPGCP